MSASRVLRRCYATKIPKNPVSATVPPNNEALATSSAAAEPQILTVAAAIARRASTPMAVRIRRIKSNKDQLRTGLTASEEEAYGRLRATRSSRPDLESPTAWGKKIHERQSRIRGFKETASQDVEPGVLQIGQGMGYGEGRVRIVGKPIYLPNFVIQLIRNQTLRGKPYNPYEATFRIPQNLTKNDLRSYLYFVYGVKTTYIRTNNVIAPFKRLGRSRTKVRARYGTFKRAVVGLVDPFYPPGMLEDKVKKVREEAKKKIWDEFYIDQRQRQQDRAMHQMMKPFTALDDKKNPFVEGLATSRAKIMRRVLERRREREKMIQGKVNELMRKDPIRFSV